MNEAKFLALLVILLFVAVAMLMFSKAAYEKELKRHNNLDECIKRLGLENPCEEQDLNFMNHFKEEML